MLIRALALLLSLLAAPAFAQVTPGTSPLSIPKGGTGGATAAAARTSLGITATGADTTYNFRANNLSDVASAPTARSNLGLAIGSNVQAWDNDLDCVAALSTTGLIKRTGTGTCSAGAAALSDLAVGTQDTVIGYFGSTTSSAVAIANCTGALTYSTSTHTFGCNVSAGTGTVTSAQISAGSGISVATTAGANPCTATCNLTVSLTTARQTLPTTQVFTSGAGTYTTPANVLWIEIELIGGGSGGSGSGGAGATVGGVGGNTTFSTLTGSGGAAPAGQISGGVGGAASGGYFNKAGGSGGNGGGATNPNPGGAGCSGPYGGGGAAGVAGGGVGMAASVNSGSGGGGGGVNTTANGGGGGGCGGLVRAIINTPSATYSYSVGTAGTAGAAGTGGAVGGAGGSGGILVIEHYGS